MPKVARNDSSSSGPTAAGPVSDAVAEDGGEDIAGMIAGVRPSCHQRGGVIAMTALWCGRAAECIGIFA